MKKWALLILLLMGLSWISSLAEGLVCDAAPHASSAEIHDERSADEHECHAGSCHFGHCGHIHARLVSSFMKEPDSHPGPISTPYSFILSRAPLFFLMRPPLAFVPFTTV